jgi:hypothetical protein
VLASTDELLQEAKCMHTHTHTWMDAGDASGDAIGACLRSIDSQFLRIMAGYSVAERERDALSERVKMLIDEGLSETARRCKNIHFQWDDALARMRP